MKPKIFLLTIMLVSLMLPQVGLGADRGDPIKRLLYPPELIMQHRDELNLSEDQQNTMKEELRLTQSTVFDLKWAMKDEAERLMELLQNVPIDESDVLNQAGKVMALEHEIKQTHLVLLVRLINMMSPTQLEMLKEFRKSWRPKNPDRAQGDK